MMRLRHPVFLLGTLALAACAGRNNADVLAPETRLAQAREYVRAGNYFKALPLFQQLTFELGPSQPELAEARYYIGECYFQTRDYVQAIQEFRRTADGSPDSPWAPLALLRAGDANLRLWRRAELDPTYGEAALAVYQELAGRYPSSDAAARATLHVRSLHDRFAEKAYKTGLFYLKRRAYDSAILYFKDVIATYPEAARVPDALMRLVDAYNAVAYLEEKEETCEHARRYYPGAPGLAQRCPAPGGAAPPPRP